MTDSISRQKAIDEIQKAIEEMRKNGTVHASFVQANGEMIIFGLEMALNMLQSLPSSQPEIIRCAECKWFQCNMSMDGYLPKGVDEFECRHWCGSCDPVDFCSHAERRTDE